MLYLLSISITANRNFVRLVQSWLLLTKVQNSCVLASTVGLFFMDTYLFKNSYESKLKKTNSDQTYSYPRDYWLRPPNPFEGPPETPLASHITIVLMGLRGLLIEPPLWREIILPIMNGKIMFGIHLWSRLYPFQIIFQ